MVGDEVTDEYTDGEEVVQSPQDVRDGFTGGAAVAVMWNRSENQ